MSFVTGNICTVPMSWKLHLMMPVIAAIMMTSSEQFAMEASKQSGCFIGVQATLAVCRRVV